jgi:hypothetical protein
MYGYQDERRFILPTKPTVTKNEYLALELTRCWAMGLPKRSVLTVRNVLDVYDDALKHLNNKENNNE